tara:strand:+ start:105 stop:698 length:594 start_codon:yes stop_codon:yes gene_type:complete
MLAASLNSKKWASFSRDWMRAKRYASHDDCINNFAKKACLRAMKLTKKTPRGRYNKHDPRAKRKTYSSRLYFALRADVGYKKGSGGEEIMRPAAIDLFDRRVKSAGANKAGFIDCIKDLGFKNMRLKTYPGGSASRSYGKPSKKHSLRAVAFNNVLGSGEVCFRPMEQAKEDVIKKEHDWAIKRLQRANNSFSAKRF